MIRFHRPNFLKGTLGVITLGVVLLLLVGGGYALFIGGSGPATGSSSINLSKGLVGRWKMDNNVTDATPYGTVCNSQFFTPSFTNDRKGRANSAFTISSAKLGFDCGQPVALRVSNVTVSAWVNPSSYNTSGNGIESYGGTVQFYLDSSGFLRFQVHDSTNASHTFTSPSAYTAGSWYFVAATYDGSTVNIYVNGAQVLSTSYTGGIGTNHYSDASNDFLLANYGSDSTTKGFIGALDDIRYYNRALPQSEITALYNQYDSGVKTDTGEVGLAGWWKTAGNAKDSSAYGNNGALGGIGVSQFTGTGTGGETTGVSLAWPSTTTAGNTLIAVLTTNNGHSFTAPSGWSTLAHVTGQGGYYIFEITNATSRSGTETFTNNDGLNDDTGLWLFELSGVDTTTPNDIQQAFSNTSTSTTATLGPATVGPNAGIAIAVASGADGSGSTGAIATSGWGTSGQQRGGVGYKLIGGSSVVNPTFTSTSKWQGILLSFNTSATSRPSLVADRKGNANGAYSFNGMSQYISVANFSNQITGSTAMTISGWVKPPNNPGHSGYFGLRNDTNADFYVLQLSGTNNLECRYRGSNGTASTAGTVSVTPGVWQLVTLVYDGSNATCYVNGVGGTSTAASGSISNANVNLDIGAVSNTPQHFLNGFVADVRFYKRALSTTEISNFAKSYNPQINLGGDGLSTGINLQKGLIGYWSMNGGAKDATPYGDNGTITSGGFAVDRKGRANSSFFGNMTAASGSSILSTPALSQNITVSLWYELDSYGTYYATDPIQKETDSSDATFEMDVYGTDIGRKPTNAGKVQFKAAVDGTFVNTSNPSDPLTTGVWHLITWTYSSSPGYNHFYIDGVIQPDISITGNALASNTQPLTISGNVDDVRIYNRPLSADEVMALYQGYQ